MKKREKKGLSGVVTILILILLVLVAIGILWVVIYNLVERGSEEIADTSGQFTLDLEITQANLVGNSVQIIVKRNPGQGNVEGLKFVFKNNTGSYSHTEVIELDELDTRSFNIDLSGNIINPTLVELYPIISFSGGEKTGNKADEKRFLESDFVSVVDYGGAIGNGVADDTQAFVDTITYAKATGKRVYVPPGTYNYTTIIVLDGVEMFGEGDVSTLSAHNPLASAIFMNGSGPVITDLKIISPNAVAESGLTIASCVAVNNSNNFKIEGVLIEFCASAGIIVTSDSSNGQILNNYVGKTIKDGIHITGRSHGVLIRNNQLTSTGDDGIAVISYVSNGARTYDVTIEDNHVDYSKSRGIAAIGDNIIVRRNTIKNSNCSGIYSVSESFFDLYSGQNLVIEYNDLFNTTLDAYYHGSTCQQHAGIHIIGRQNYICENITVRNNNIENSYFRGSVIKWCEEVDFRNNLIFNANSSGIIIENSTNVTIFENIINKTYNSGIFADTLVKENITINNNNFQTINFGNVTSADVITCSNTGGLAKFEVAWNYYINESDQTERYVECLIPGDCNVHDNTMV